MNSPHTLLDPADFDTRPGDQIITAKGVVMEEFNPVLEVSRYGLEYREPQLIVAL